MKEYYEKKGVDPYLTLPVTFHIKDGLNEPSFEEFKQYYERNITNDVNMWIIKPGENSNRGRGIQVASNFAEIEQIIEQEEDASV